MFCVGGWVGQTRGSKSRVDRAMLGTSEQLQELNSQSQSCKACVFRSEPCGQKWESTQI